MTITRGALVVAVAALLAANGCTASSGGSGGSASCAGLVTYDNRDYLPTEKSVFTVGERLGTARVAECADDVPESRTGAYRIEGTDPAEGIAVGDSATEAAPMAVHR
ncbi:hypothetical protein DI272_28505 [Streptomyces sp. Act143]|uniref:DUF6281 family protein n=1 Tax=Streptomyces sp. Act143 TaxID=2200760 RepID=UPI000D67B43C|nr:DUF6281 family protein [Streptomyces sp. Act143]PWI17666.1 hypothetical protein DI272_28505 [Streptomyces sp. Act143]